MSGNGAGGNGRHAAMPPRETERGASEGASLTRDAAALGREVAAEERDRQAELRDAAARKRDLDEGRIARALEQLSEGGAALARNWARRRARAAADRVAAARDRRAALADRAAAALDRTEAAGDLALAAMDELTWTKRRGPGLRALEREIERSERTGEPLSIAYLDVDGLKAVNDTNGHAAGDRLLMDVADALRGELRGYDLVARVGGDEFLCVLPGADSAFARARFADIVARLERRSPGASFSVAIVQLEPGEPGERLIQRADMELLAGRSGNGAGR